MRNKLVSLFILTFSAAASGNSCVINQAELPFCEGNGYLVPKHLPAAVSFPPNEAYGADLSQLLSNFSKSGSSGKIGLFKGQLAQIREIGPQALGVSAEELETMISKHVVTFGSDEGHPSSESDTAYMRDATIFGIDPSTGNLRISRSAHPNKYTAYKNGSTFCGLPVTYNQRPHGSQSERGGNIIALPGGACLSAEGASKEFLDMVCGPGTKRVTVGRTGSNLGHVDELINIVPLPGKEPPCNFAVVIASQRKFNEVLRSNPDKAFFGEEGLKQLRGAEAANQCASGQCMKEPSKFCKVLDKMAWLSRVENEMAKAQTNPSPGEKAGKPARTQSRTEARPKASSRVPASVVSLDSSFDHDKDKKDFIALEQDTFPALHSANRQFQTPDCARYRNQDVLRLYEAKNQFQKLRAWLEEEGKSFIQKNTKSDLRRMESLAEKVRTSLEDIDVYQRAAEKFDAQQDESWKKIKEALPAECQSSVQKVDLPMGIDRGSLNPNPTNLQVIGDSALYPKQFNAELDKEIKKSLEALGLKPIAVNTLKRHTGGGNVHCLSNEIRTCRPR